MEAVEGEFSFGTAIRVDKEKMCDLQEILSTHYTEIKYSAQLLCNKTVFFGNLSDLLGYNNYDPNRIISIEIICSSEANYNFVLNLKPKYGYPVSFTRTVFCVYSIENLDDAFTLERKLEEWCNRCKSQYYKIAKYNISWLFHKINDFFGVLLTIFLALGFICTLIVGESLPQSNFDFFWSLILLVIVGIFLLILNFIDRKYILHYFQPLIFYWGDEIQRQDHLEKVRSQIFWGVIVTIIVGLFVNHIS